MIGRGALGKGAVALMVVSAMSGLTGCGDDAFPDYHYKMTIYAGGKVFSSVRAVEREEVNSIVDSAGRSVQTRVEGQAVIIDLPNGQTVYALLSRPENADQAAYIAHVALMPLVATSKPESNADAAVREYREDQGQGKNYLDVQAEDAQMLVKIKGAHDLPRTLPPPDPVRDPSPLQTWPFFVAFDNAKDPKSVREVNPAIIGVSRITIEITDEPVTTGIDVRLPWALTHTGQLTSASLNDSFKKRQLSEFWGHNTRVRTQ